MQGVHALTDITGFGLAGHALELARGAKLGVRIAWSKVPLLAGVRDLATQGMVTGASGRNWGGYGADVRLPGAFAAEDQALLTDPQTSGGLLVACAPDSLQDVMACFGRHGFAAAAAIGRVAPAAGPARLVVER